MSADNLLKQISFIKEIDKLKYIQRKTKLFNSDRPENDAEHSWHLAMMTIVLAEHADIPVDLLKVGKMVLVNDIVEIDATGSYVGDVCGIYPSNLTIRGVNGRPKIDAGGRNSMGKRIWVLSGNNTTIENVEMFGARVNDRNGAALRLDGQHLTLRGSYLHHNENGILTNNDGVSNVTVETTEFAYNGYGDGYSHNLYNGNINSLILMPS